MDIWSQTEKRLKALKEAGIKEVGEELPAKYTGGPPREQVLEENKRRERWLAYKQKRWAAW